MAKFRQDIVNRFDEIEAKDCFCFVVFKLKIRSETGEIFLYCSNKRDIFALFEQLESTYGEFYSTRYTRVPRIDILYVGHGVRLIPLLPYTWLSNNNIPMSVLRYQTLFYSWSYWFSLPQTIKEISSRNTDFNSFTNQQSVGYIFSRLYVDNVSMYDKTKENLTFSDETQKTYLEDYQYTEETRPLWLETNVSVRAAQELEREIAALDYEDEYDDGGWV